MGCFQSVMFFFNARGLIKIGTLEEKYFLARRNGVSTVWPEGFKVV